jgi:ankyrin repeat protein
VFVPAPPPASANDQEIVVTSQRAPSAARAAKAEAASAAGPSADSTDPAAKLHAAAAAGRTAEVTALLADGAAVDAPDREGETALMKAVRSRHPTTAALLRRQGASLDVKNHAGVSAREMANAIGDARLNRALGLGE